MFKVSNGELAWPLESAGEAVTWIASNGLAVLGGEAWRLGEAGRVSGVIPLIGISVPAVRGWSVAASKPDESWADFVERCLSDARSSLSGEAARIDDDVPPSYAISCATT
jgi:hypothetical protein